MSLLFETILIENEKAVNLQYHEERMNDARLHFWQSAPLKLADYIPGILPAGRHRCRIEYDHMVKEVFISPLDTRQIYSLRIVYSNRIEYSFKFSDRQELDNLFSQRGDSDDILIIKKGLVTDTSIANIVFTDGKNFFTPAFPLLIGTRRKSLIDAGILVELEIKESDISRFSGWQHINALNPLDIRRFNPVNNINRD